MITQHILINFVVGFHYFPKKQLSARTWRLNWRYHSIADIPALEWAHGQRSWHRHNRLHRAGGLPAVIRRDGSVEYHLCDMLVTQAESAAHRDDNAWHDH